MGVVNPGPYVLLIHGTFAPGAAWTQKESLLYRTLEERVPNVTVARVEWSGGNSYAARSAAAASITEAIDPIPRDRPVFLVAHSHGGNAALYAVHELAPDVRARVRGVVCLATPFIETRAREIPESDQDVASHLASALLWTPLLVYCSIRVAQFDPPIVEDDIRAAADAWRAMMVLVLAGACVLRFIFGKLTARLLAKLRQSSEAWARLLETPAVLVPVLTVRTTDGVDGTFDEAVVALRMSRRLINMMFSMWETLGSLQRPQLRCCSCGAIIPLMMLACAALALHSGGYAGGVPLFLMQILWMLVLNMLYGPTPISWTGC